MRGKPAAAMAWSEGHLRPNGGEINDLLLENNISKECFLTKTIASPPNFFGSVHHWRKNMEMYPLISVRCTQ